MKNHVICPECIMGGWAFNNLASPKFRKQFIDAINGFRREKKPPQTKSSQPGGLK